MKHFCCFFFSLILIVEYVYSINILEWKDVRNGIRLKWNITTIPDYIEVFRRLNVSRQWEKIQELNSSMLEYTDRNVTVGKEYYYKVRFVIKNIMQVTNTILGYPKKEAGAYGKVLLDLETGVPNMMVVLENILDDSESYRTYTDQNGNYVFDNIPFKGRDYMFFILLVYFDREVYWDCVIQTDKNVKFSQLQNYKRIESACIKKKKKIN